MSTTKPEPGLVSVVVPTYNVAATLDQCLASIEGQTHRQVEIIVVNDGSTDESSAIAHAHAARDQRVIVVDKPNEGYGASCNRGIAMARGEWLSIVEPDDYLAPGAFAGIVAQASRVGGADVVKCAYWRVFESVGKKDGQPAEVTRVACQYKGRVRPAEQPFAVGEGIELVLHHPAIWAALYRTEFLRERGIRFLEIPGAGWADNPFMVETLCATDRIAYVDEPYYFYREHDLNDAEALAARNPLTPLTRWNDMMDAAERLGVTDQRVLDALTLRGINYATITVSAAGIEAPGLTELLRRSMERLDVAAVMANPAIGPGGRQLFAQVMGLPAPRGGKLAHMGYLAREGAWRVRQNGLDFTVRNATSRLNRLFSRK